MARLMRFRGTKLKLGFWLFNLGLSSILLIAELDFEIAIASLSENNYRAPKKLLNCVLVTSRTVVQE
jgi:hypothetical protein